MKRAADLDIGNNNTIRICSAEDLIIHKALAGRPRDLSDIESIIIRQGKRLDAEYIQRWLKEFSIVLEMPEILERFEKPWEQLRKE